MEIEAVHVEAGAEEVTASVKMMTTMNTYRTGKRTCCMSLSRSSRKKSSKMMRMSAWAFAKTSKLTHLKCQSLIKSQTMVKCPSSSRES